MSRNRTDILKDIDRLRAEIKEREDALDLLLLPEKQIQVVLPSDFSINEEILKILRESGDGLSNATIQGKLKGAFPTYGIDTRKVNSAIVYLKKRGNIEPMGRARYRIKTETPDSTEPEIS